MFDSFLKNFPANVANFLMISFILYFQNESFNHAKIQRRLRFLQDSYERSHWIILMEYSKFNSHYIYLKKQFYWLIFKTIPQLIIIFVNNNEYLLKTSFNLFRRIQQYNPLNKSKSLVVETIRPRQLHNFLKEIWSIILNIFFFYLLKSQKKCFRQILMTLLKKIEN